MFLIVIALLSIVIYSIYKMLSDSVKSDKRYKSGDFTIEYEIMAIKSKISEFEERARLGMENAEATLLRLKEELKKAEEFKSKHNL